MVDPPFDPGVVPLVVVLNWSLGFLRTPSRCVVVNPVVDFESLSARSFELLYRRFLTLSRIDRGFVVAFDDPVVEVTKDVVDVGESVGGVAVERERRRGGVANSWSRLKLTWLPGICTQLISEVAVNTPWRMWDLSCECVMFSTQIF